MERESLGRQNYFVARVAINCFDSIRITKVVGTFYPLLQDFQLKFSIIIFTAIDVAVVWFAVIVIVGLKWQKTKLKLA